MNSRSRSVLLSAFVHRLAIFPFQYGKLDCGLSLADWWAINHGIDPAARIRGTYSDHDGCMAMLERERGMLRLVWSMANEVGALRTKQPRPGACAVVRIGRGHHGAIMTPRGKWAIKLAKALHITTDAHCVVAWSIDECRRR